MIEQKERVSKYFDEAANAYHDKNYGKKNKFLQFFFTERLSKATDKIDFENKTILDIGCGTGSLYNYLISVSKNFNYLGTDISSQMLNNSLIPEENRYLGNVYDVKTPIEKFDYIYLLGVVTYIDKAELNKILNFIHSKMQQNSSLILTINNKPSLTYYTLKILSPLARVIGLKNKIVAQNIKIQYFKIKDFEKILNEFSLKIINQTPLNQTIYPLNNIFPNFFIKFSNLVQKKVKNLSVLRFLSSDVLLTIEKETNFY